MRFSGIPDFREATGCFEVSSIVCSIPLFGRRRGHSFNQLFTIVFKLKANVYDSNLKVLSMAQRKGCARGSSSGTNDKSCGHLNHSLCVAVVVIIRCCMPYHY